MAGVQWWRVNWIHVALLDFINNHMVRSLATSVPTTGEHSRPWASPMVIDLPEILKRHTRNNGEKCCRTELRMRPIMTRGIPKGIRIMLERIILIRIWDERWVPAVLRGKVREKVWYGEETTYLIYLQPYNHLCRIVFTHCKIHRVVPWKWHHIFHHWDLVWSLGLHQSHIRISPSHHQVTVLMKVQAGILTKVVQKL